MIVYSDDFLNIKYTGWNAKIKNSIKLYDLRNFQNSFYLSGAIYFLSYTAINLSMYYFLDEINKK